MTGENSEALTAKIVAMVVTLTLSVLLGALPIKLAHWFKWHAGARDNIYARLLLCLGGGVLLATTLLHLLPEVAEGIEGLDDLADFPLPMAQLLMCIGFFIIYFIEEVVHHYLHHHASGKQEKALRRSISRKEAEDCEFCVEDSHMDLVVSDKAIVTIRSVLMTLALSIHALFEGMAVGLESSPGKVWYMFLAIGAHKFVIATCVGIELTVAGLKPLWILLHVFTFAVVTPLGIGIGIGVTEGDPDASAPSVILQGLSSGTLLYVVFFEILSPDRKSGLKQFAAVLLGFIIMACLSLLSDE